MSGRRPVTCLALGILLGVLGAVGGSRPVSAHGVDPTVRTVLDEVSPVLPGVTVQVATSVSTQLVAENTTDTPLLILAETGEPFLRIVGGGTATDGVEANLRSPSWFLSNSPTGQAEVPAGADPAAEPRWARVADEPSWGWFDHRLHPDDISLDADQQAGGPDELRLDWEVPFRYGDTSDGVAGLVRGHLEPRRFLGTKVSGITGGARPVPGVTVQLLQGQVPGLLLRNDGAEPVVVRGAHGEPFLRVGPDGTDANLRSPAWAADSRARDRPPSVVAEADAPPEWESISPDPVATWLEFRAAAAEPSDEVLRSDEPTTLLTWSVPVEAAGASAQVTGVTRWVPAPAGQSGAGPGPAAEQAAAGGDDGDGLPGWAVPAGVAVTAVVLAGLALRPARRRSRARG
ncbi:hypothetical protein BH20ACT2_BH20ACT2_13080 [soil metagenome]